MSGLIRGKIECVLNTGNRNSTTQASFKLLYDYFSSHPNYSIIALQYGLTTTLVPGAPTGGSGTGVGFYDQPSSFGYNSFFVVRANATTTRPFDVYHMFQWAGASNFNSAPQFGSAPGSPGLCDGSANPTGNNETTLGYACAIGIGGTGGSALSPNNGNPWKGTTTANGTDTKAAAGPIWGAPAGGGTGVIIFPRSNSNVGAHRSLTQNMGEIENFNFDSGQTRWHIIGDDDSFVLANDFNDNGAYILAFSGLYTPRNNLSITYPYLVITSRSFLPLSVAAESGVYGDNAGTSANQGGIVMATSGTVAGLQLDHFASFATDANFWPNKQFGSTTYDQLDIPVGIFEIMGQSNVSGFMGQIDFIREMFNVPSNAVSSDYSRIFIGSTTLQDRKYAIPWDRETKTTPRSGLRRDGYSFTAPSLDPNK